jgi:hypothetical protein
MHHPASNGYSGKLIGPKEYLAHDKGRLRATSLLISPHTIPERKRYDPRDNDDQTMTLDEVKVEVKAAKAKDAHSNSPILIRFPPFPDPACKFHRLEITNGIIRSATIPLLWLMNEWPSLSTRWMTPLKSPEIGFDYLTSSEP